ncbi:hypothetical protein GCM10011506_32600 [Marivirga lumbricoides]|uniref:ABC transporter domain-containing protein n=1 Tax=Marivirga lumbricoides TaxID=1046115 RepID=A0ABQ1MT26_9BACT|nr:hypothetical protein GCM10011506_32600 [Marivirga lumbricoides]
MIRFESISKSFDSHQVLKDISLEVKEGELLVLLGASGSGKTTLLKMINGLIQPDAGNIFINNNKVTKKDITNLRRNTGYVIQQVGLFPHYSVFENIALVPRLLKHEEQRIKETVKTWMDRLGLPFDVHARKLPAALSGGQAQRVGLARALAGEPQLILMDEPFSALDPVIRAQIRNDFRTIQKREKITAIMVTHDLQEAVSLADRICLLAEKKVQQLGKPSDLIFKPANSFVKNFIQSDRFQAALIACKIKDLKPFLTETELFNSSDNSLLEVLQTADSQSGKALMSAFYQWEERFR